MTRDGLDFFAYRYTKGIVRKPGSELTHALSKAGTAAGISFELARAQHIRYVEILKGLGIDIIELEPNPAFPDGCFVEDTCVMMPDLAVITKPGAPSRRGEALSIERAIAPHKLVRRMSGDGTLDGGDILRLGRTYLMGLSERTAPHGAEELGRIVRENGVDFRIVEVPFGLHLKSAVTPLASNTVLGLPAFLADPAFNGCERVVVPEDEAAAACVVAVNGRIMIAGGFPETKRRIEQAGFPVIVCDISEFAKADGGLTCLSVLW